jgi:L-ascorbate metabolism protein UlaG (beta-lactamase superfamily)
MPELDDLLKRVRWFGRSSLLIQGGGLNVYFDPAGAPPDGPKADVVFMTHPCDDHFNEKDVEAISTPSTVVAGPRDCVAKFRLNQMPLRPGVAWDILGLPVKPVAAYNPREGTFHPRHNDWLGYFVQFPGVSMYLPGATSFVPEMKDLRPDVMFFPVAARDGFRPDEFVPVLTALQPKVVVPVHHGPEDRKALEVLAQGCRKLAIRFEEKAVERSSGLAPAAK